jgi:hypothetical protein
MALTAGSCIVSRRDGRSYLSILLTNPEGNPRRGLFVSLEHYDTAFSDSTVVLNGEHDFIRTTMAAKYQNTRVLDVDELERQIAHPNIDICAHDREPQCTPELLTRLQDGIQNSPFVAPKYQRYCEDNR